MRKHVLGFGLGWALALGFIGMPAAVAQEPEELTIAIIRTEEMSTLAHRWEKIIDHVSNEIGKPINFYSTTSYASVVEAMLSGFVDIGKLGPKIYIVAHEKSEGAIVPIVATAVPPSAFNDEPCACYFAALITKADSGLDTVDSLQGKTLALVDPGSTSGNVLPRTLFTDEIGGAELEDHFGRVFYSGSHSASARAVKSGQADAAFVSLSTLANQIETGEVTKEDFNYLWRSPEIPLDVVTVNKDRLSPELIDQLTEAFLGMDETPEGKEALEQALFYSFVPADDARFDPVRKMIERGGDAVQ